MKSSKTLPLETGHYPHLEARDHSFTFNPKSVERLKEIMEEARQIAYKDTGVNCGSI